MESGVGLNSNFQDYYDFTFDNNEKCKVYNRVKNEISKVEALNNLSRLGIKTIDIKPISKLARESQVDRLVVYNDIYGHGSESKSICTASEALIEFNNYLGSKFVDNTDGVSIKVVHVGKRVFRVLMKNESSGILTHGKVLAVNEASNNISFNIMEPIYSIDYIPINNVPVAIDFNNVQNLQELGLNKYMSADEVHNEVIQSLRMYRLL